MKQIQIGTVKIPLDSYAIGGTAVLGIREAGKTYLSKGIAEQLLDFSVPIIAFDAIGVWRHMKRAGTAANGKGYRVVVAGGREPDLPLTPKSAPEIVRAAIAQNVSLVIDLYDHTLSKGDWRSIVRASMRTLLYQNEGLRHVFLEETPEYAPQRVTDGETYAEVEKLVRMGGNRSLGITLISQRAQEVNKAVLDLCENVVLMRQRGAHAIDSLEKFMDRISPDVAKEVAKSLPGMSTGEAWVFTTTQENPTRIRFGKIRSFHPDRRKPEAPGKVGEAADVSTFVANLQTALGKMVEDAKANDPARLRSQIVELQRQLAAMQKAKPGAAPAIDREALQRATADGYEAGKSGMLAGIRRLLGPALAQAAREIERTQAGCTAAGERLQAAIASIDGEVPPAGKIPAAVARPVPQTNRPPVRLGTSDPLPAYRAAPAKVDGLPSGEAALLRVALQYDEAGGVLKSALSVLLVGFAARTRQTYQQRMRAKGLIDDAGERIRATDAGRALMPTSRRCRRAMRCASTGARSYRAASCSCSRSSPGIQVRSASRRWSLRPTSPSARCRPTCSA
jgi:hypothetical protein